MRTARWFVGITLMLSFFIGPLSTRAEAAVTLEVLNPRGEIPPVPVAGLSPRLASLDGKKIGLIDNLKTGADRFLTALEEQLKMKAPGAAIIRYEKPESAIAFVPKFYEQVAQECDAFMFATGD